MGMFDNIHTTALNCPLCGYPIQWQTKDGPRLLEQLTIHELTETAGDVTIYGDCNDCRITVDVRINQKTARTSKQWAQYRKDKELIAEETNV